VEIQTRLVKDFPEVAEYRRDLARMFNNLRLGEQHAGRTAAAEKNYREALAIWEPLLKQEPRLVEGAVSCAGDLCNLAHLLREDGRASEALGHYDRACAILGPVCE